MIFRKNETVLNLHHLKVIWCNKSRHTIRANAVCVTEYKVIILRTVLRYSPQRTAVNARRSCRIFL